jgi:ATP-dependent helicase/nuclease subunit A
MAEQRVLLPAQAAAAYEINKHISVTAGPGSGKTTVLVERYLHILREYSLSIDQIVAITFTNRAANEMRERLREDLHHMLRIATDEERRRWINYKRTLDGAVITTIHGFCARLPRDVRRAAETADRCAPRRETRATCARKSRGWL